MNYLPYTTGIGDTDSGTLRVAVATDAPLPVVPTASTTATVQAYTALATVVSLGAADATVKNVILMNKCDKIAYVLLGSTSAATTSNFSFSMAANTSVVLPFRFSGAMSAIWEAGPTGSMLVTRIKD